jgi:NADPH:quinone reductase-like Zn-dependent oxidoreductase
MASETQRSPRSHAASPSWMMACRVHRFGPPEVITFEQIEPPTPGTGQVLVQVQAAGVGPWDGWIRAGKSVLPQALPLTLGSDLAGIVQAVGPNVTTLQPGDAVFGVTNAQFTGAYAEYALASVCMLARRPPGLAVTDAASIPVVAVTAQQAIERAGPIANRRVLIHGGAGSVGAYAVQLAHRASAAVIATAGTRDLGYVRGLGADEVIDYRSGRFEDAAGEVDVVLDFVGGEAQQRSFGVLRSGGTLISAVSEPDQTLAQQHGVTAGFFLVEVTTGCLLSLTALIDSGQLSTNVGTVLPLADARVAHEVLEGTRPRARGKIVLQVDE